MPGSWELAAMQARACARVSPGISLHYWQLAVERAGHRAEEVLGIGMTETARISGSAGAWEQYAHNHLDLLLTYARNTREPASRRAYEHWWTGRGSVEGNLDEREVDAFYKLVSRFGTREQFDEFCERHADLRAHDFRTWVSLLHAWNADDAAWQILTAEWPAPNSQPVPPRGEQTHLALRWGSNPRDVVNARDYAEYLIANRDTEAATEVILTVARRNRAPDWFVRKGAHLLAADGKVSAAVALFLGEDNIPAPDI